MLRSSSVGTLRMATSHLYLRRGTTSVLPCKNEILIYFLSKPMQYCSLVVELNSGDDQFLTKSHIVASRTPTSVWVTHRAAPCQISLRIRLFVCFDIPGCNDSFYMGYSICLEFTILACITKYICNAMSLSTVSSYALQLSHAVEARVN